MLQSFKTLLRSLTTSKPARRITRRTRLQVELLESRLAPAVRIWDGGAADNLASSSANWLDDTLPVAGDTLVFDGTSSKDATVDALFVASIVEFRIHAGYNGIITLDRDLTVSSYLLQEFGTLDGPGSLFAEGNFDWLGGVQAGTGTTQVGPGGALTIAGEGEKQLIGRSLVNAGTATWSGGPVFTSNAASFVNEAGASFDIQADTVWGDYYQPGYPSIFINDGALTRTASSGTTSLLLTFINNGVVEVEAGTLELASGGSSTGSFTVAAEATLHFSGGSFAANAGTSFLGDDGFLALGGPDANADLVVAAGTVDVRPTFELMPGGSIDGAGTLQITNTLEWTGGTMKGAGRTTVLGALNIDQPDDKTVNGRFLLLDSGAITTWIAGTITLQNNATIDNEGRFEAQGDYDLAGGPNEVFQNQGHFVKTGNPLGILSISTRFNNYGGITQPTGVGVEVQAGEILFLEGGEHSSLFKTVGPSTSISFSLGEHTALSGTLFTGDGWTILENSGVLSIPVGEVVSNTGKFELASAGRIVGSGIADTDGKFVNAGTFKWSAGRLITLVFANNGQADLVTDGTKFIRSSDFRNFATVIWSDGDIELEVTADVSKITNLGNFEASCDRRINAGAGAVGGAFGNVHFINDINIQLQLHGVFSKTAGAGATAIDIFFTNHGTVNQNNLTINFNGGLTGSGTVNP